MSRKRKDKIKPKEYWEKLYLKSLREVQEIEIALLIEKTFLPEELKESK